MTAPSVRPSSVFDATLALGAQELHLWLCPRRLHSGCDQFGREVLSHYAPLAPANWRFCRGENGKPGLVDPPRPLSFNLSGSADWLVCAVTATAAVGVDIEHCDPNRDVMKLARRFFSAPELAALQACPPAERVDRFYDYWTLKEAQIKSTGGSLFRDLEVTGFELAFPARNNGVATISAVSPHLAGWAYYCLLGALEAGRDMTLKDYRLALCCHTPSAFRPHLRLFEVLDGGSFRAMSGVVRGVGTRATQVKLATHHG